MSAPDILSERWWREINSILADIECAHIATKGAFKQPGDREALDVCSRAERRLGTTRKR